MESQDSALNAPYPNSSDQPGSPASHLPSTPHAQHDDRHLGCGCQVHIENRGTINIYCTPPAPAPVTSPPEEPSECPPLVPPGGACVPLAVGSKPKKSLEAKLRPLLENNQIPSVLAAAFLAMARRFLLGREPGSSLESEAFTVFRSLTPDLRAILVCCVQTFDALPLSTRDRLVDTALADDDRPVTPDGLAELVAQELLQRTSLTVYGDADCLLEERPGLPRVNGGIEAGEVFFTPVICRVNGLRTNQFEPHLAVGDLKPEELQRVCTPEIVDSRVQLNCRVLTADCPGNDLEGTCLRVPDVRPGEAVTLEGLNFFNVAARVRLTAKEPGTTVQEVEAHVCGDVTTPLTETVNGRQQTIRDCRVHDRLTFKIPEDLPEATYGVVVVVPNNTGIGNQATFESLGSQFIRVVAPETATFQIASERLDAIDETDPDFFGSDEVAIRILTIPIGLDLTPGAVVENKFRFDDMDSGDTRAMNRVLFRQSNVGGVSLAVIGFEVDDEDTFTKQIQSFSDAYVNILKGSWNAIAGTIGSIGGTVTALALGLAAGWAGAIAAAITFAIDAFVAWWAPADLIIEDAASFLASDLTTLTGANFPPPPLSEFTSAGGIKVSVAPVSKDVQYTEHRDYRSDDEGSHYRITLRYNRF
jgi:hypothetical protein